MNENIRNIILSAKSKSDACMKVFGYNNKKTLSEMDKLVDELNHTFVKKSTCLNCGKEIKNYKKFCSKSCSATHNNKNRKITDDTKKKISNTLKSKLKAKTDKRECSICGKSFETTKRKDFKRCEECRNNNIRKIKDEIICIVCGKSFLSFGSRNRRKTCSNECLNIQLKNSGTKGGRKSIEIQSRRSKNEIYFAELCSNKFKNIRTNETMFNGWDADVIIENLKIAVLWNGNWHHKKIKEEHSLTQVQNRDKIKIKEIEKCGYKSYIINDYGKHDKYFVEKEFEKLVLWCNAQHASL